MLLAESLLLLLTDDTSGKPTLDTTRLDLALAGAVMLELAQIGRVDVTGPGEAVKPGRLVVRDPSPTGDAVLDGALAILGARKPDKPKNLLSPLAKDLRPTLLDGLVARGVLRRQDGKILGLFPTTSWPAADSAHEHRVRQGLHDVLVVGRTPSPQEAALVSLLQSVGQVPKVVAAPGVPARELTRRAKAVAAGDFAGEAVRKAVEEISAAMVAVMAATSTAVISSG